MSMFHLFHYITSPVRVDVLSSSSVILFCDTGTQQRLYDNEECQVQTFSLIIFISPQKISVLKYMSNFTNGIRDPIALVYK